MSLLLLRPTLMLLLGACGGSVEPVSSPTPYPAYTPYPTYTPVPIAEKIVTVQPISTSAPTRTPEPPAPTAELTATATLTPLPTDTSTPYPSSTPPAATLSQTQTTAPTAQPSVEWSNETGEWTASSTPPECGLLEEIFVVAPIDVSIVNEFARPGRPGGNGSYYLAHGYLRAHNTPHDQIEVKFPAEGFSLYAANRRVEQQRTFPRVARIPEE